MAKIIHFSPHKRRIMRMIDTAATWPEDRRTAFYAVVYQTVKTIKTQSPKKENA